jgi:1-acyl-sn-glycerol-3-phosphate acyltransferase
VLAKKEFFRIPILSLGMRLAKFVPVDRSDREAAIASVDTAVDCLREGFSFAIFAEGTRSSDGRLRQFMKGAAVMAIDAQVPIVPVSIVGTYKLMKKGAWSIRPGIVTIRFGDPISTKGYEYEQRNELIAHVRDAVAKGLPPEQQPLP